MSKKILTALALGTFLAGAGAVGVAPSFAASATKPSADATSGTKHAKKHHAHHARRGASAKTEGATPSK